MTAGTNANTLKAKEAGWVSRGYPGPDFPPVTSPPDPNDQVGIIDGNSSGIVIDEINKRFVPGDEVLCAVYSGTVMTIPDFAFTVAATQSIGDHPEPQQLGHDVGDEEQRVHAAAVTTTAFKDWGDAANPYGTSLSALTFTPQPATPATTVTWSTFNTTAAPVGIYTVWVKGHSASPYLTDHYYPIAINIGGVNRDFSTTGSGLVVPIATSGLTGTGSFSVSTPNNNATAFLGNVTLTIEGGADDNGVLPTGIGAMSLTPSTITLNKGTSQNVAVSINGGSLGPGEYPLTIRVTGTNSAGQKVTRLVPIIFDVATAGTASQYVDIMGWAVFRITAQDSNTVSGYAISRVYADPNDSGLRRGQTARLVPWN